MLIVECSDITKIDDLMSLTDEFDIITKILIKK